MTAETKKPSLITAADPTGCDFVSFLDQGAGTPDEVAVMARDVVALSPVEQADQVQTASSAHELATAIGALSYPGTKQEKLLRTLEENTGKAVAGALAGAYIAANCIDCPAADGCNLLQVLRTEYTDGVTAKAQNETMAIVVQARRIAEDIKPKFTALLATEQRIKQQRMDPDSNRNHRAGDIMRATGDSSRQIGRALMSPESKPYRNETIRTLRQLIKEGSNGAGLLKRAEENNLFKVFDGLAVEAFVSDALNASEMVTKVTPATREEDVFEGTDLFVQFLGSDGLLQTVRIDAKSRGYFQQLKAKGELTGIELAGDTGHFGLKHVQVRGRDGSTRNEAVLVISPMGNPGDIDSSFRDDRLASTGCVDLQQDPSMEFTTLIDTALQSFVKQYH